MNHWGFIGLQTIAVLACINLQACISFGRDPKPDYPPPLDAHHYDARLAEVKAGTTKPVASIAGARLAKDGIYVDVILTNLLPMPGVDPEGPQGPGAFWSDLLDDPSMLIEVRDGDNTIVELRKRQRPRAGGVFLPGTCILYMHPPHYLVEQGPTLSFVEVVMFRTKRQLAPGTYRMRLQPPPPPDSEHAWIWEFWGGFEMDTQWRTVQADWADGINDPPASSPQAAEPSSATP